MKKILSIFLVALSALGLTATAYASPQVIASVYDLTNDEEYNILLGDEVTFTFIGTESTTRTVMSINGVDEPYNDDLFIINVYFPIVLKTDKGQFNYNNGDQLDLLAKGDGIQFGFRYGDPELKTGFSLVELQVFEDLRPAISGQETFATNVDEARPVEYFINYLRAIDDIDGDISDDIYIITDNYTPNKSVLGSHEVKVGVEDSSGNISEFTFKVYVSDITKPIISGNQSIVSIGYKETYDFENFRKTLTVTDNYSSLTNADIKLKTDNYTTNKGNLGTYEIIFEAKDSSGNAGTFTKTVKVIDNIAPVFGGVQLIEKPYTEVMTLADILGKVTASDEIDGNLTARIKLVNDGFTGNSNKVGTYHIELSVTDNAGNTTARTITIKVFDNVPAGWYVMNGVSINLTPGTELTRAQIIDILHKTGQIVAPASSMITYDVDTYSENIGTPGSYMLSFSSKLTNGVVNNYTYTVNVLDELQNGDNEIVEGESFLTKVWNFIQNVYIAIVNFFKAIWNAIVWVINLFGTGLEYTDYWRFK